MIRPWLNNIFRTGLLLVMLGAPAVHATPLAEANKAQLLATYRLLEPRLRLGTANAPLTVATSNRDGLLLGDAYAIIDHPYTQVTQALRNARSWCDIVPLHMNVKACTTQPLHDGSRLTFYAGRKSYQAPGQARALVYTYRIQTLDSDYFSASLTSDQADADYPPLALEATPLGHDRVLIHVRYASRTPLWLRVAADSYFATIGARKVGFSTTGTDRRGQLEYVGGLDGAVERNALRYYLALESYFNTDRTAEAERFDQRLNRWFDLTERYSAQLHEMDKTDYLRAKRKERIQQLKLQQQLDARH